MEFSFWQILLFYHLFMWVGMFVQLMLASLKVKHLGKLLPLAIYAFDFHICYPYFKEAFVPVTDFNMFITSLTIFIFVSLPAVFFFLIELRVIKLKKETRKKQKLLKMRRKRKNLLTVQTGN